MTIFLIGALITVLVMAISLITILTGKISELEDLHSNHEKKLIEIRRDLYNEKSPDIFDYENFFISRLTYKEIRNKLKKLEEYLNIEYKKEDKHIEEYVKKASKK